MNTVFVILHYLTIRDTLEAVASIKKFESEAGVVIVDNASGNGSLEELREKFNADSQVDIVTSSENGGFARGNNLGIEYARKRYSADFICLMNNDVLLIEKIMPIIYEEYNRSHCAVLGPMIYTADGRCDDNPGASRPITESELRSTIKHLNRMVLINKMHLCFPYRILRRAKRELLRDKIEINHKTYLNRAENVQLHGSFLVLCPKFFESFVGLYPGTFLNMEEDILFYQLRKKELTTVYLPCVHIFHKEDAASKKVWPKERKRAIAKIQNCLDSARAFLKLMKES